VVTDTNSLNKTRTYTYDAVGDRIQVKDRNNRIRKFVYDLLDRNTSEIWVDSSNNPIRTFNYTYDAVGELTKVTDPSSTYSYTYDAAGRNTSVDNTGTPGVPSVKFDYSYDAVNNLVRTSDAINGVAKGTTNYVYDALNRATSINQSGSGVVDKRVDLAYDAASFMTGMTRYSDLAGSNQVAKSDYTYDAAGRLNNLKHSHHGNTIANYGWTYDGANRITKSTSPDGSSDYSYDLTNQLTGSDHSSQTDESYQYDSNGNRTGNGYTNGANNQLLSDGKYNYEYDGEGNRTKRTEIATGKVDEYVWDYRNRLTNVVTKDSSGNVIHKKSDYAYDAFDKRISKSIDADGDGSGSPTVEGYVYDGDNLALVFDGSGQQKERFLHGIGVDSVIAQENADGQVLWAKSDNQGSVRDVINSNGQVLNHYVYDSFGKIIAQTNPGVNFRFSYTGRELDNETGNYYYRSRFYDPQIGRFINEDTIGFNGGDSNLYSYVFNSPVNFVDPSGHGALGKVIGGGIGAGLGSVAGGTPGGIAGGSGGTLVAPGVGTIGGGAAGAAAGEAAGAAVGAGIGSYLGDKIEDAFRHYFPTQDNPQERTKDDAPAIPDTGSCNPEPPKCNNDDLGQEIAEELIDRVLDNKGTLERGDINSNVVGGVPNQYAGHHLIPVSVAQTSSAMRRGAQIGYNINNGNNGVAFPTTVELAIKSGLPLHRGKHIPEYFQYAKEKLNKLDAAYEAGKLSDEQLLKRITKIENQIRKDLLNKKIKLQKKDPHC
jgi:RHS repeat-associated protein